MIFAFGQRLGRPDCPYLRRWAVNFGLFSVRLHHWIGSDDQRAFHDHEWAFLTLVLKGGYIDQTPQGREHLGIGAVRFRRPSHQHTVKTDPGGCWTLLLTGPKIRTFGFWVNGKFRKRNKYFYEHGVPPCD